MSFNDFKNNLRDADDFGNSQDNSITSRPNDNPDFVDMLKASNSTSHNPYNHDKTGKMTKLSNTLLGRHREKASDKREERMRRDQDNLSEQDFHMKYSNKGLATKMTLGLVVLVIIVSVIMKLR